MKIIFWIYILGAFDFFNKSLSIIKYMYFIIDNDLLKKSKALKIYIQKMIFITSLVLLLIIKLRFPKGKSIHRVIQNIILLLFAISAWHPHEILRMRMSKFMRISADPDAELRYTSNMHAIIHAWWRLQLVNQWNEACSFHSICLEIGIAPFLLFQYTFSRKWLNFYYILWVILKKA